MGNRERGPGWWRIVDHNVLSAPRQITIDRLPAGLSDSAVIAGFSAHTGVFADTYALAVRRPGELGGGRSYELLPACRPGAIWW